MSCQTGPAHASTWPSEKTSWPAGTGVCVVKTLDARTRRTASSKGTPSVASSRTRSSSMNAACPSLACHTAGRWPRARSMRTPPTPRIHSWRSRTSSWPPYNRWESSRSAGSFSSRSVSRRYSGTRPTIIRQAPTRTERPPVCTETRDGALPGPTTRSRGVTDGSNLSSAASCQPSSRRRWSKYPRV